MNNLLESIDQAVSLKEPAECNRAITECHYQLSQALRRITGPNAGANFHSWAVWGSKKAGVTIRQEDLDQAKDDAMRAGGISGLLVGGAVAKFLEQVTGRGVWYWVGSVTGPVCGAQVGKMLAIRSRRRAAELVLEGNKLVLNDIGRTTARFVELFSDHMDEVALKGFLETLNDPLLSRAFQAYGEAALTESEEQKHQACYFANCLAILFEHQKLQKYIEGAMPVVVRRCVTKRLLTFDIGARKLSVSQDIAGGLDSAFPPTLSELRSEELKQFLRKWSEDLGPTRRTAASDWTNLGQRMRYILDLFRFFHLDPDVVSAPSTP